MTFLSRLYTNIGYYTTPFTQCRRPTTNTASAPSSIPFDALPNVVVITNKDGNILDINKIGADLLGYEKTELLGKPFLQGLIQPSDEKHSPEPRWTFSRDTTPDVGKIALFVRKDGSIFPANVSTTKYSTQTGEEQFLTTIIDCTEHQRKLHAAKMYAIHLLHDTRGSVGVIRNALELLEGQVLSPDIQDPINSIRVGASDVASLVNDTLDLEKVLEQETPELSGCFLKKFLADILMPSKELAKAHKKKLIISLNIIPSIYCSIARGAIAAVLRNLLSNAIKFTPSECKVPIFCEISLDPDLNQEGMNILRFKVTNHGIGFTEEQKAKIFTFFQQASPEISKIYGGTGIGLPQSKEVIEKAGGTLDAESAPNNQEPSEDVTEPLSEQIVPSKITIFFGIIPFRITQAPTSLEIPESKTPKTPSTPRRILFVDDDAIQGKSGSQPLKKAGHKVVLARSLSAAKREYQEQENKGTPYDLVVTDLNLQDPDGDGLELARCVTTPVILLTGTLDKEIQEKANAANIKKCIVKGSKPKDLQDAIEGCFPPTE